jgi:hypothetical protein
MKLFQKVLIGFVLGAILGAIWFRSNFRSDMGTWNCMDQTCWHYFYFIIKDAHNSFNLCDFGSGGRQYC